MSKKIEETIKEVNKISESMESLSVDKVLESAPKPQEVELQTKITAKEIADKEGYRYIEPARKMPPFGTLKEEWKKEHAYDWEYVAGIFENQFSPGENVKFWYSKWPGDPDTYWVIPANIPVYVPRMIANHLANVMQYHSFGYREMPDYNKKVDEFTHKFEVIGTQWRGKFQPIGAFR